MRSNWLVIAVAIAGLAILSTSAPALEPGADFSDLLHAAGIAANAETPPISAGAADECPATNLGVLDSAGGSIVGSTFFQGSDFRFNVLGCADRGRDVIFEFTVDNSGLWFLDTCTVPACWNTTLMIREESGGGCPGDFVACDDDGCGVCELESRLVTFLAAGTTYYLIVDGRSPAEFGDFEVTYYRSEPCQDDVDCDDGVFCNGVETCELATNECAGGVVCTPYQTCDEVNDVCIEPDPCITWRGGAGSQFFFPQSNICADTATWVFDDIQTDKHASDVLDWYTIAMLARSTPNGAGPLGATYSVNQALWTVEELSCHPLSIIAGSMCTNSGVIAADGSPPDVMQCWGAMPSLPNNDGDFDRCEVDFFIAYRTAENGAGFWIPREQQTIGGLAARDEFGIDVVWLEDCPPTGLFGVLVANSEVFPADFAIAEVCQNPAATCCEASGACTVVPTSECMGVAGEIGTIGNPPACGGDPDGDGLVDPCDNCPNDANADQGDCDGDGEGDACEADEANQDDDGDGVCNGVDNCPLNPDPNQDDTDGDGAGDPCDPCPIDPNDDSDGDGVCDSADQCPGGDDRLDDDLDGVPDDCDVCPGSDDNVPSAQDDADRDGVLNCNDKCPDVDDAVFGPECEGAIPTASQWGLIVLTLLLLAGGKVCFGLGAKRAACS